MDNWQDLERIVKIGELDNLPLHKLESVLGDCNTAVIVRRILLSKKLGSDDVLNGLPHKSLDYTKVFGSCCENVIGYIQIPVGIAGPLNCDNELHYVPMATTEGCLVASTNRGCRALLQSGVTTRLLFDGMTTGPVVKFSRGVAAANAKAWLDELSNQKHLEDCFQETTKFGRLKQITSTVAGKYLFIRFVATTGDAMGINMVSKGAEHCLNLLQAHFPDMQVLGLSGNYCTDKKCAAINFIEGRGKSVLAEAIVPGASVKTILKSSVAKMVELNIAKNLVGSAMAVSVGGYNAQAANIVSAIFLATGQDVAQTGVSSNCITLMEPHGENGEDLYVACTMPSLEVGTVGGGTALDSQAACLELLGVKGSSEQHVGKNAAKLARIICATVLAGEISLIAALSAGHLVQAHMSHNRNTTKNAFKN